MLPPLQRVDPPVTSSVWAPEKDLLPVPDSAIPPAAVDVLAPLSWPPLHVIGWFTLSPTLLESEPPECV
jgi:hypothetical protein